MVVGRVLHPSYRQALKDSPAEVTNRLVFRVFAFLLALAGQSTAGGIAIKYCIYLLYDQADISFMMPVAFRIGALIMGGSTVACLLGAFANKTRFPWNARLLVMVVILGGTVLGFTSGEIGSRMFVNSLVVICSYFVVVLLLARSNSQDMSLRKPYIIAASCALAAFVLTAVLHPVHSIGELFINLTGVLTGPVTFKVWQSLPQAYSDEDVALAVDCTGVLFGSMLIFFGFAKLCGLTSPY